MKKIETERMILRKPKMKDAQYIYEKWMTGEETFQYQDNLDNRNLAETRIFLKSFIKEAEEGMYLWFIEEKISKNIIGYIKIPMILSKNKTCHLVFYFQKPWRNHNFPEEAVSSIIQYLFEEESLETIFIKFFDKKFEETKRLETIMRNIGMQKDGIMRNQKICETGRKVNLIVYSILKEEYQKLQNNNLIQKVG